MPPIGFVRLSDAVALVVSKLRAQDPETLIAEACEDGRLRAAYRTITGAEELDQAVWRAPHWRNYFDRGTIVLELPLLDGQLRPNKDGFTARCEREIFVRRDSLNSFVDKLEKVAPAAQAGALEGIGKSRRGRRPKADWDAVGMALQEEIKRRGRPDEDNADPAWRRQADVEQWAAELLEQRNEPIKESRLREKVAYLLRGVEAGN